MPVQLRIDPVLRQPTPMSCWWTCIRMVFTYYGRVSPTTPDQFSPEFRRSWNASRVYVPRVRPRMDATTGAALSPEYLASDWYELGVPMEIPALEQLCSLTGFRGIPDRPAFGRWTLDDVERLLRRCGPYIFLGNWNGQGFHAVLVTGRVSHDDVEEVVYIDPAMGMELSVNLDALNRTMANLGTCPMNPIYLPTEEPVRATL